MSDDVIRVVGLPEVADTLAIALDSKEFVGKVDMIN